MRESVREQGGGLDAASKRLERALSLLETRLDRRMKRLELREAARGGSGDDHTQLVAELNASRARERALEAIAAEASAALGRAAEEVRAALAEPAAGGLPETVDATAPPPPAGLPDEAVAPEEMSEPLPIAAQG